MMNELQLKVSDGERAYPFFGPYSKNFNYESLATERKLTEVHTVVNTNFPVYTSVNTKNILLYFSKH